MADSINLMLDEMVNDLKWCLELLLYIGEYKSHTWVEERQMAKKLYKKYFGEKL